MAKERKLVTFDWALKRLFRSKVNYDVLEDLLSALLKRAIKILGPLESEGNKEHKEDKFNRVALIVQTTEGEKIIIEFQASDEGDHLKRVKYGEAKVVTESIETRGVYAIIPKIISVSILFFDLGKGKDYIYKRQEDYYGVHNNERLELSALEQRAYETNKLYPSDVLPESYLINIPRFDENGTDMKDHIDQWIYFLKTEEVKPEFKSKGLERAEEVLSYMKLSPKDKSDYNAYEMAKSSQKSHLASARDLGEIAGEERGIAKGIHEMILNMHEMGISKDLIAQSAKMPLETVEKILASS
jgi:predicted transposase/invertase (TIGR01784 family)